MNGVLEKGFHIGILRYGIKDRTVAAIDPSNTLAADRYIEDLVDEINRFETMRVNAIRCNDALLNENEKLKDQLSRFENAIRQYQYDIEQVNKRLTGYFQILSDS